MVWCGHWGGSFGDSVDQMVVCFVGWWNLRLPEGDGDVFNLPIAHKCSFDYKQNTYSNIISINKSGEAIMNTENLKVEQLEGKEIERTEILDIFVPFIQNLSHSFVVAINSPWGTGKTTFVNQCIKKLGEEYPAIYYNAWKSDFSSDPFIDFCAEILDMEEDVDGEKSAEKKNVLDKAIGIGKNIWDKKGEITMSLVSKIGTQELAEACGAEEYADEISTAVSGVVSKQIEEYSDRKSSTDHFTTALEKFVTKITSETDPLIIFVDELDRCRPSYAVELLERVKHLFDIDNIVFVLSVDLRQLKYAVESIYGPGMESEGYLRRFFDIVIDLPELSMRDYCKYLSRHYKLNEDGIISHLLSYGENYNITLRQIDKIFTLLKIVAGNTKWQDNYLINLESYAFLKVLDRDKYDQFKKSKKVDNEFIEFVKKTYRYHSYYAAAMISYMLSTMQSVHRIETNDIYTELLKDQFWKDAFSGYKNFRDGSLEAMFNRLDFTADHARTGLDY